MPRGVAERRLVIMVGPALDVRGGISSIAKEILDGGIRDRYEVEYVSSMVDGGWFKKAAKAAEALTLFKNLLAGASLVHIHISKGASFYRKELFAKAAQARGVPYILHEHDGEFDKAFESGDERYRARVRALFGSASRVIVLSEEWRDFCIANRVCDPVRLIVLHNAVNVPDEGYIDNRFSSVTRPQQGILFLGRLAERKSPDVLLRSANRIKNCFPEMRLVFGGDGYPEYYERLANELEIADICEFLGWVGPKKREQLFAESAIYCLPSKHEGMPMSVLEAMAHGLATVATPVGGVPQVIVDGKDGLLIPVDDEIALAKALSFLLTEPLRVERLGRAAHHKIVEGFGIGSYVERLSNIYDKSIGERRGSI